MKDVLISIFQSGCLCFAWNIVTKFVGGFVVAYIKEKIRHDAFLRLQLRMGEEPKSLTIFYCIWSILTLVVCFFALYNIYLSLVAL